MHRRVAEGACTEGRASAEALVRAIERNLVGLHRAAAPALIVGAAVAAAARPVVAPAGVAAIAIADA
eukprot:73170-Prymnesium_polylepis.2